MFILPCSISYGVVARPVKLEADHTSFVITASQLLPMGHLTGGKFKEATSQDW